MLKRFNPIQGTGLVTGPTCMLRDARGTELTWGTATHVWADDGFGTLHVVDRDKAYSSSLPFGYVSRTIPYGTRLRPGGAAL